MALSQCQVVGVDEDTVIGLITVDTSAPTGNDYLSVDFSLVGPAGPWTNVDVSGGIAPAPPSFQVPQNISGLPTSTQVWVRWQQFDTNDVLLDEEVCTGFTNGPAQLTGEVCCGLAVRADWQHEEYGYSGGGYGHRFHTCVPPGVNDWTPLGP